MSDEAAELFSHAPCGYAVLDSSGLILDANVELLRLVGLRRDEVVGHRSLPSLVSVGGRIYFDTHIFPMLELQGAVHEVALEVVRSDGGRIPVLLNANVAADPDPARVRVRAVVLEARDRRRYETDLLEAYQATEAARREAAEMAEVLQQTLIPPSPPRIEGLVLSAAYRPAGDGSVVGGDFYDVFQVADHEWVLVIGDVLGKGVEAATVTSFVRHTVRDLAMQVRDPDVLLARLDRAVATQPSEKFCTVVVARLSREGDDWTMVGSAGGHPLPLVRQENGAVAELGTPGSLIGLLSDPTFTPFHHVLSDDVVLFYTDGVVEARRQRELYGEERLARLMAETPPDVGLLTEAVVEAVLAYQDGVAHDDIAVLAVQRVAEPRR